MTRPSDPRFDALTAHADPDERRVDAGDGLDPFGAVCAFRCTFCYQAEHCCAYEVEGRRDHDGVEVPACHMHMTRGGFLHDDAREAYVKVLAERLAQNDRGFRPLATAIAVASALRSFGIDARVLVASGPNPGRVEFGASTNDTLPFRLTVDREGGVVLDAAGACAGACDGDLVELIELCMDVARQATQECSCDPAEGWPDPLCREHGHEDVVSGAYDRSPSVRAAIDAELARVTR